ncbi:MAG: aminoacetone oxidase family FAD-binding enzyme [Bacteroidaceae bacterium]|nr:aminoacetone oxidase family FAD-binding enzyme [Bacteroidaceae bacterium]
MGNRLSIAIIGAGAAGCFCAINLKRMLTDADVHIFESKGKALAKVAVTGGGRCNLTNTFRAVRNLQEVYPRGEKLMRRALSVFSAKDTCEWFRKEGVRLVEQEDECIFPQSQDAMQIVNTLLRNIKEFNIQLHLKEKVTHIDLNKWDRVVVTTGGHATLSGFSLLEGLDIPIESPVPSLFTFNVEGDWHQLLMGTVVEDVQAFIPGTRFRSQGALLLTHWGMSGPAILRLSSYAARYLAEHGYKSPLCINWMGRMTEQEVRELLMTMMQQHAQKLVTSVFPSRFVGKHWNVLLSRMGIPLTQRWGALNTRHVNKMLAVLTADEYQITGRCPFKEEFVTCGGVSLKAIDINTLQSKQYPGLYFAGEVLDVDAVTGGFNLQAAWSMGYVVAKEIAKMKK